MSFVRNFQNVGLGRGIYKATIDTLVELRTIKAGYGIDVIEYDSHLEIAINGAIGTSGFSGHSGETGYSGFSGFSGYSGKSGYSGYSGTSGYSGKPGPTGQQGLQGISGYSGYSGYSGAAGISGFSGWSGKSGFSGYSGISGYSGFTGPVGPAGISGFSGYSGAEGISGFSGYSGISGYSGYSGISGFSGYSGISGYSGYSGISGYSGAPGSIDAKESARLATTILDGNIDLIGATFGGTIDGISVNDQDRILIKNQTLGEENGIYIYDLATNTFSRSVDADSSIEVNSGMYVFIEEGPTNSDSGWILSTPNPIILNTTPLLFVQFTGAGQITAGDGLSKTGNTLDVNVDNITTEIVLDEVAVKLDPNGAIIANIGSPNQGLSVNPDNATIEIDSNELRVIPGTYTSKYVETGVSIGTTPGIQTINHNLGTRSINVVVFDESTFEEYLVDIVHTTLNSVTIDASGSTRTVTVSVIG